MWPGSNLNGRDFNPPIPTTPNFKYTFLTAADSENRPPAHQPNTPLPPTEVEFRILRTQFLDNYTLEISEETPTRSNPNPILYRYWRWLGPTTITPTPTNRHKTQQGVYAPVMHWERRLLDDPLPQTPGLWPQNS